MDFINIFGIKFPTYSLMIISGVFIGNILAYMVIKKKKLCLEDFIMVEVYGLAFGMLGAKLLYLWVSKDMISWNRIFEKEYFLTLMEGGFVFYGGLFGGIIGVIIAHVIHKIDVKLYFENLIFCIPLVHAFGRIGCYFAGCCYGIPYSGFFHVRYHNIQYSLCDIDLFPVQLVEAIGLFILAIVFYNLTNKKAEMKNVYLYFVFYSILRFIVEIFRFDSQRGSLWMLSTSQWISLFIFLAMSIVLFIKNKKYYQ
ncbi:prolipoprotein diacylglyceryl transferase family protein [Clostridium sp.]|uniref:prolipoprotein diacylglyceryl transferase n=1 Tax=Clostridium sp. TaxID=1506 RepID=UPI00290D0CFA|nr:prolipoprotein diacylglyceryl transferase family protein [Clostridium sp.]MDU5106453.1 prolipoprotein diacylglyceryl transferase [Clostridium sp.]